MLPNPLVNVIQAFKVSHIPTNNIPLKGENNSTYSTYIANIARIVKVTNILFSLLQFLLRNNHLLQKGK